MKVLNTRYMKSLNHKLIVYDSNCKVCSSLREVVLRMTPISKEKVVAYRSLSSDMSNRVDPVKFRNGMALIDTTGGATIYGPEGVAYIFSSQYKIVDFLLSFQPVFKLFTFLYKTLAYNRYIIATPKSNFLCDCFPDKVVGYRVAFITIAVLVATILTALFGNSLRGLFPGMTGSNAAMQMLLMAGTGWVVLLLFAVAFLGNKALDYVGHLSSIMIAGLLILVPWIMLHAITGVSAVYIPALSVVLSSATMLYLHINRVRHLDISQAWTVSWFILLQTGAAGWIFFFHIN